MSKRTNDLYFRLTSLLSQELGAKDKNLGRYAGSDQEIGDTQAMLNTMIAEGEIKADEKGIPLDKDLRFYYKLLDEQRKARFATSDKTSELSKMGLQLPKEMRKASGAFDDAGNSEGTIPQ